MVEIVGAVFGSGSGGVAEGCWGGGGGCVCAGDELRRRGAEGWGEGERRCLE